MNFVLHAGLGSFLKILKPDTTVYLMAYTQGAGEDESGYVSASTDLGIDGGTVHAVLIRLLDKATENQTRLDLATEAFSAIVNHMKSKQVRVSLGILSTAGLDDAIEQWRRSSGFTLEELRKLIEQQSKGQVKVSEPKVSEPERE